MPELRQLQIWDECIKLDALASCIMLTAVKGIFSESLLDFYLAEFLRLLFVS